MYREVFDTDIAADAAAVEVPRLLALFETLVDADGRAPLTAVQESAGPDCGPDFAILGPVSPGNYRYLSYGARIAAVTGVDRTGCETRELDGDLAAFSLTIYDRVTSERRPIFTIHRASLATTVHLWERLCLPCKAEDGSDRILCFVKPREFRTDLLNAVLEASRDGILALRAVRHASGELADALVLTANKAAAAVVGRPVEELLDGPARKVLPGLVTAGLWERIARVIEDRKPEQFELDYALDGLDTWFRVTVVPLGDGVMMSFSDVTELKYALFEMEAQKDQMELAKRHAERAQDAAERARREAERARGELQAEVAARRLLEEELRRLAQTDGLTGILSRRGFDEALRAATSAACRYGYPLSLIAIDVDHFKAVNDTYGHAAGDAVLKSAAAMLREELRRNTDILGRVGGEEFMIVLPHTTVEDAVLLAERLRERLSVLPITVGPNTISVTASFGVQELGPAGDHELMLIGADDALYEAKRSGRNRVVARRSASEAARPQARPLAPS